MTLTNGPALHVMAKVTGAACNLNCSYCYYLAKKELYPQTPERDFRLSEPILREYIRQRFAAQPNQLVTFEWQGGEPTLAGLDYFRKLVCWQHELCPPGGHFRNVLQTNAILIDTEWAAFLNEHDFLVGVSLDGPAHLHDVLRLSRGGQPTHARVLRGLRHLQAAGVAVNLLCTVNAANAAHPEETYLFLREQFANELEYIHLQFLPVSGNFGVSGDAYGEFLCRVFALWQQDTGRVSVQLFEHALSVWLGLGPTMCVFARTCGHALALEHNGDLYSCDHFVSPEYHLGNLLSDSLEVLAGSLRQAQFGETKRSTLSATCRQCDVLPLCQGDCPRNRTLTTPGGPVSVHCAAYKRFFRETAADFVALSKRWQRQDDQEDKRYPTLQ